MTVVWTKQCWQGGSGGASSAVIQIWYLLYHALNIGVLRILMTLLR